MDAIPSEVSPIPGRVKCVLADLHSTGPGRVMQPPLYVCQETGNFRAASCVSRLTIWIATRVACGVKKSHRVRTCVCYNLAAIRRFMRCACPQDPATLAAACTACTPRATHAAESRPPPRQRHKAALTRRQSPRAQAAPPHRRLCCCPRPLPTICASSPACRLPPPPPAWPVCSFSPWPLAPGKGVGGPRHKSDGTSHRAAASGLVR